MQFFRSRDDLLQPRIRKPALAMPLVKKSKLRGKRPHHPDQTGFTSVNSQPKNKKARSFRFGLVKTKLQLLRQPVRGRGRAERAGCGIRGNGTVGVGSTRRARRKCASGGQLHVGHDGCRCHGCGGQLLGFQRPLLSRTVKLTEVVDASVLL